MYVYVMFKNRIFSELVSINQLEFHSLLITFINLSFKENTKRNITLLNMNIMLKIRRVQISRDLKIIFRFIAVLKILYWKKLKSNSFQVIYIFKWSVVFRPLKEMYYFQINIAVDQLIGLNFDRGQLIGLNFDRG